MCSGVLWCCWLGGRKGIQPVKKTEWWDVGVVMYLGQDADLHMAQLMPLPLTISCSSKSRLVLPSWCWLNGVIPDKIQEGCKMVVCVFSILLVLQWQGMWWFLVLKELCCWWVTMHLSWTSYINDTVIHMMLVMLVGWLLLCMNCCCLCCKGSQVVGCEAVTSCWHFHLQSTPAARWCRERFTHSLSLSLVL